MKVKHILVDMDPTQAEQPALTKAIILAKEFGASIELFLVDYHNGLVANWFFNERRLEELKAAYLASKKRWLDSYVNQVVDAGISVSTDVSWHKPLYEAINQKVVESHADLAIKSTHRHPTVNKIFFTPNDWQLLKTCPVPLLMVKSHTANNYRNIMAAIDPSQSHDKAQCLDKIILDTTQALSVKLSAVAHVAHCYQPVDMQLWNAAGLNEYQLDIPVPDHQKYLEQLNQHHIDEFTQQIKNYNFAKENQHIEAGFVSSQLLKIVDKQQIDLIVMGTTYRTGLLGSTVENLLDDINCDILAVKCED